MDLKLLAVLAGGDSGLPVTRLCAELGISRDTYYQARRRFTAEGITGLLPHSRRPLRSPNQIPAVLEEAILRARKELAEEGWDNGARSIAYRLTAQHLDPPAVSTINRVLRRNGLVQDQPAKRPHAANRRFEYPERNGCWQMDGTEWKLADGSSAAIIGMVDDHTRRTRHHAARSENGADVWACFVDAVQRFGMPARVLTDNGLAFNGTRRGWQVEFTTNLLALGVQPISSGNYHPQTCGKRERLNGTLKRWLARQRRARTLAELQDQLDTFDQVYNARPHQGLNGATPDQRWASATQAGPVRLPAASPRITTVTIDARGCVSAGARYKIALGRRWTGLTATVITQGLEVGIFHGNTLLHQLTLDPTKNYQPSGAPRGGRRQARVLSTGK